MTPPCLTFGRLKPWWVENFQCKTFPLIIPAFRWATTSSAGFYTLIHFPPLVGIPSTRNRGQGIHCRCNLRCKTTNFPTKNLLGHGLTLNICCAFSNFLFIFLHQCMPIIVHQGCPSNNWTKHTVSHHFKVLKLIRNQRTGHKAKYTCGSDDRIKKNSKFQTQSHRHILVLV